MVADRFVLKQFAGSATNNGAFGAAQATGAGVQPVEDIKDVQSLNAFEQGWNAATLTSDKLPALEEMQGLEALLCKALKENYSEGVPFWIAGETYFQYSFVNYNGVLYYNTTGSYTNNNPATDTANWAAYNKVGTATVGTDDTPIYLNTGTPTAGKRIGVVAYDNTKTYSLNNVILNIEDDKVKLYRSLVNNNTSPLTDGTKWTEVSLGGGGGEIGDMGFAPLGIDESLNLRRYLNGQVISQTQFVAFTTKVKSAVALFPSLATTEATWQAEKALSKFGQVGKFVIDDDAGTIRLPAVVNAQGLLSLSGIGNLVNESLPNITGTVTQGNGYSVSWNAALNDDGGALYGIPATTNCANAAGISGNFSNGIGIDASRSSSTYQDNAPVQQEAVQYPYYIQVATGIEETLPAIREYKVNNSDFFGKSMYSDVAPDNASWLASNGQYNARIVYPYYYDWLVAHVGETITANGGKVVLSTDTITDYDFVVNQDDQTFRLSLLNGKRVLVAKYGDQNLGYNWYSDGWIEQWGYADNNGTAYGETVYTIYWPKPFKDDKYTFLQCQNDSGFYASVFNMRWVQAINKTQNSIQIWSRSDGGYGANTGAKMYYACGYAAIPTQADFTEVAGLYYYVGDTVQDASLINAGAILNTLSGKVGFEDLTTVHCVVETYQSGASWYRVYDDGWVEQGGYTKASVSQTTSFLKTMASLDYNISLADSNLDNGGSTNSRFCKITSRSTAGFTTIGLYQNGANTDYSFWWQACGQGA